MPAPTSDPSRDAALFDDVRDLLRRGRNRLRRRHLLRGAIAGAWFGAVAAIVVAGLSRLWWHLPVEPAWVVAGIVPLAAAIGALADSARIGLRPREVALLLDRTLGTDELLVTALHLEKAPASWSQAEVIARVRQRLQSGPVLAEAVPLRVPRRTAWLGPLLLVAATLLWVPELPGARGTDEPDNPLADEAARLEERLDQLDEEFEVDLPEDLETRVEDLVEQLRSGELDEEQARERIAELQEQVAQLQDELEPSRLATEDLQAAAEALAQHEATRDLGEALAALDPEEAAAEASELAQSLSQMSSEERQEAGEALQEAGERLRQSQDDSLREVGEKMERAGRGMQGESDQGSRSGGEQQGEQGTDGQSGEQQGGEQQGGEQGGEQQGGEQGTGGEAPQGMGSTGEGSGNADLQSLSEEIQRQESLAERLRQDGEALAQSQELNGALEGTGQRLGGESSVADGESSGEGQGGAPALSNPDYGTGHTWEDEGTSGAPTTGHHDADRQSDRQGGKELDDFERLYDPLRMENSNGLLTGVEGTIDEDGHIAVLPTRLTGAHEDASAPLVTMPPGYREAADEALSGERVPAGYREAVKQYFDGME